ncbi:MAG: tRNA preQ1(34) S-adenosylmethionine ribosyltransferase-isomerase QueA [Hyphomicrobiales bacterium]
MRVDEFDFDLPLENIALRPANPRDSARLLVVSGQNTLDDSQVIDLPDFLNEGDVLVFNDTKVIPAQLEGHRLPRAVEFPPAKISVTLHMRVDGSTWDAFVRPGKKIKVGDKLQFVQGDMVLEAKVAAKGDGGEAQLVFPLDAAELDRALFTVGHIPLPPYIASKRPEDEKDREDYQTIYAREDGAVAAPTAGLHFTDALFEKLDAKGVCRQFVTLHVGAGTFLPVKADDTKDHKMHFETGSISADVAEKINVARKNGKRIIAVGTTSLRLLESAAQADGRLTQFHGATDIFITPGYRFKLVDMLMTNFHLPRSTLMMLVSAFSGLNVMREAYQHAIKSGYRFYSYGDSSLLFKQDLK